MRFDLETVATPEQVRRALTDFSERRGQIWSRTLDANAYELRELGDTWAVARESTSGSPFWVVARYDWSDPDVVRWTVVESSYGGGGEGLVRADPSVRGGSRVHVEWTSTGARGWQKPIVFLLHHGPAGRLFARMWASTFDRYARTDPA
ncbi:hypothetical protein [Nocardioides euryhalodurans]|uniref:SRPBCC family protein n=1 Tax=Nocardioides euryhalodurans TaxID=2518370 RepID=A0A4P7GLI8_9ACTN|nr:hypothetical protein [Nocardioides euryhalodurans]QBR92956.1 hypothetical protein EXE57_12270 [Nocardioides euryhalodurans]